MTGEVLKQLRYGLAKGRGVADLQPRRLLQPLPYLGFIQMKDQVVGAQAGDVALVIEILQRVVEVVGKENLLDVRAAEDLLLQAIKSTPGD